MANKKIIVLLALAILSAPNQSRAAGDLAVRLSGRLLLQVEAQGQCWYVNPLDLKRYYLGRPNDALTLMRRLGLGVSNRDLASWRGLAPARLSGRILLRVEAAGEAYYVYPLTLKMYYLGRPTDAFQIMRGLGLGISDQNLSQIPAVAGGPASAVAGAEVSFPLSLMEKKIFDLVNQERSNNGLVPVAWNEAVAAVAREHSQDLAEENSVLIDNNKICSYPFIHHEGTVFGLYHSDRLNNRSIYNFSSSAENIALLPLIKSTVYLSVSPEPPVDCQEKINLLNENYESRVKALATDAEKINAVKSEAAARAGLLAQAKTISVSGLEWHDASEVERQATSGWMASPGHRANILGADYNQSGLGIARVKDYIIITQVFIKTADCGYQGGPCCEKTGYYPYCYLPLECQNNLCQSATPQ